GDLACMNSWTGPKGCAGCATFAKLEEAFSTGSGISRASAPLDAASGGAGSGARAGGGWALVVVRADARQDRAGGDEPDFSGFHCRCGERAADGARSSGRSEERRLGE